MDPLSSKILNNQIISMRKEVRKAVVHQIHGLTQKANRLRIKNGSDEQKKKNALKADNFISQIQILKKLKADEVSLFALSNPSESDLRLLIFKPIISAEGRAMAKLCLRENMMNVVKEFISRYNGSLELLNNLISERCSKTEKQSKKKKKKVKQPSKNSQQSSKTEELNCNKFEDLSDASESIPQLTPTPIDSLEEEKSVDIIVNSEENESEIENVSSNDDFNLSDFSASNDMSVQEKSGCHDSAKKKVVGRKSRNPKSAKKGLKDDTGEQLINKNILSQDKPYLEKRSTDSHQMLNKVSKHIKTERKKVDPFFKTPDNTEYFTYCDIEDKVVEKDLVSSNSNSLDFASEKGNMDSFKKGLENKNKYKKDFYSKNYFQRNSVDKNPYRRNFYEKATNNKSSNGVKTFSHGFNGKKERNLGTRPCDKRPYNSRETDRKPRNQMSKILGNDVQEIKLHPSWEAKKKINQPPVVFQGKKIVFDD